MGIENTRKAKGVTGKDVFTTGQVAKICKVTIRTVIKWYEAGKLEGYKIPASKDRRIPRASLLKFLRDHDYPFDPTIFDEKIRVLVADDDPAILSLFRDELSDLAGVELSTASCGYKAGFETARTRPRLLILDYNLGDIDAEQVLETLTDDDVLADTRVVVMTGFLNDAEVERLKSRGMTVWKKPLDFDLVRQEIRQASDLIRF